MSDTQANESQPQFSVQKIYNRDVSFENPNAPQSFNTNENPKIDLNLGVENRQVGDEHWEVALKVSVLATTKEKGDVIFEVEVEQAALFLIRNIPEEHMTSVLAVDCPTIIFPYTRQLISQLTTDGGFMPLILEPVNFAAAFQNTQAQQQQEGQTKH